jgi:hypothetical protein
MGAGRQFVNLVIVGVLCAGGLNAQTATPQASTPPASTTRTATRHHQPKPKKAQLPPPLPSGPQGPVPQIPLDSIPAVAPQVNYQSGELTIVAPNSTLGDILRAVRKQTAAEIEIPPNANERVVTHLGPGPARAVVAELLNGSKFNYVLLGSASDATQLTRVVLVAKTSDATGTNAQAQPQQPGISLAPGLAANMPPQQDVGSPDANDSEAAVDESVDDNADQNAAEAEQQQQAPGQDQSGIKTPQQMLQEMQQRQLQMQQQQQQPGQPPTPGPGYPPGQPQPPPQQQ